MRITRDDEIGGVSAVAIRDAFRFYEQSSWTSSHLAARIGLDAAEAVDLVEELLSRGFIEKDFEHQGCIAFTTTVQGSALAQASAAKPIRRVTADRYVKEVIKRAAEVNAGDEYFYRVKKIAVFGSYITDCPTLGDLDLAIDLQPKLPGSARDATALIRHTDLFRDDGCRRLSYLDRMHWPTAQVCKALKGASKAISLHPFDDPELLGADTRVIYSSDS